MKIFQNKKIILLSTIALLIVSLFSFQNEVNAIGGGGGFGLGEGALDDVRRQIEEDREKDQRIADQNDIELNSGDSLKQLNSGIIQVDRVSGATELYKDGNLEKTIAPEPGNVGDLEICNLNPFSDNFNAMACVRDTFGVISVILIFISGKILFLSAVMFEWFLKLSIQDFGVIANNEGVTSAWGVIRDLSNIFFIFIMLYIAIGTILDLSQVNAQQMITRLVIVALLINFSMPITRAIIDSGNILSLWLYDRMTPGSVEINERIVAALNPAQLTNLAGTNALAEQILSNNSPSSLGSIGDVDSALETGAPDTWDVIIQGLGATVVILTLAFTFLAAGFLFLGRTVWLVLLIIVSPFAYLLKAFPQGAKFAPSLVSDFWDKLLSNTFFAPVYMALLWISVEIMTNTSQVSVFTSSGSGATSSLGPIIYFIFIVALLVASLVTATNMGAWGANAWKERGSNWQKKIRGVVGRNTVGRASFLAANSRAVRAFAGHRVGGILGGRALQRGLDAGANLSFVDGKNYKTTRDEAIKTGVARSVRAATDEKSGDVDFQALERIQKDAGKFVGMTTSEPGSVISKKVEKEAKSEKDKVAKQAIQEGKKLDKDGVPIEFSDAQKKAREKAAEQKKAAFEKALKNVRESIDQAANRLDRGAGAGSVPTGTIFDRADFYGPAPSYTPNEKFFDQLAKLEKQEKTWLDKIAKIEEKKDS